MTSTIEKLSLQVVSPFFSEKADPTPALLAAFAPFGSLTWGVNGQELAEAMAKFVDAPVSEQPNCSHAVLKALWSTTAKDFTTAEFGRWEVRLRTPMSKTEIKLSKEGGGSYRVEIDFGYQGSTTRSNRVVEEAKKNEVTFEVKEGPQIPEKTLLFQRKKRG